MHPTRESETVGTCIACGGPLSLFGPRLDYEYHICGDCGTLQLFPQPTPAEMDRAYVEQYAGAGQTEEIDDPQINAKVAHNYHQGVLDAVVDHRISGPILDVGAGWGGADGSGMVRPRNDSCACWGVDVG